MKIFALFRCFLVLLVCLHIETNGLNIDMKIKTFMDYMQNEENTYMHLFNRIQAESDYRTCLIFGNRRGMLQQQFLERKLQQQLLKPLLIYDAQTVHQNALNFNSNMLIIVYLEQLTVLKILENLMANLKRMTQARIILVCTSEVADAIKMILMEALFRECQRYRLLNTIAIFQDFAITRLYYSYTQFPKFLVELKHLLNSTGLRIFPPRMHNLYGHAIRTTYQQLSLDAALMLNMNSELQITYVADNFLELLAAELNATLEYSYRAHEDSTLLRSDFLQLIRNGSIDIPNVLSRNANVETTAEFSYPLETAKRCVVVLIPRRTFYVEFFTKFLNPVRQLQVGVVGLLHAAMYVINRKFLSISLGKRLPIRPVDFFLNMHVMAGQLGFSHDIPKMLNPTQRILCVSVSVMGMMYSTAMLVRFQAFLNSLPVEATLLNWNKLQQAEVKIVISRREHELLMENTPDDFQRYQHAFQLVDTFEEFSTFSDKAHYAYPLTTSTFATAQSYQQYTLRSLLRPTNICLKPLFYLGFPLAQDSIYEAPLNKLIMRVQEMGLLHYWTMNSFEALLTSDQLKANTAVPPSLPRVMMLNDFRFVWIFIGIVFSLSTVIFLWELGYQYKIRL